MAIPGVDPGVPPSGPGCADCGAGDGPGWWLHLRRCAQCGHVGCCDSSPSRHASAHSRATGHPIVQSYEPGEDWFWSYAEDAYYEGGPRLAPPDSHPEDQPVPGPGGRVPDDWMSKIH